VVRRFITAEYSGNTLDRLYTTPFGLARNVEGEKG